MPSEPPAPPGTRGRTRLFGLASFDDATDGPPVPPVPPGATDGGYAALGVATTGLTPIKDRVVELAVVLLDADATPREEWTTLVHPEGRHVAMASVHGLDTAALEFAPSFAEVAREFLGLLEGRVVVAHNAELVEEFLAAELLGAGLLAPTFPTLDVARLAQRTFDLRNHRLATLAAHLGLPGRAGESAPTDARLVAGVLPHLLARHGDRLVYPVPAAARHDPPPPAPKASRAAGSHRPAAAAWPAEVMTRVAMSAQEANDPRVLAYLEALTSIVVDHRIVTAEARELTGSLVESGYPAGEIRRILERLLESLREAAFAESRLTRVQLGHLRAIATSVGVPTYFDDLIPPAVPAGPRPGSGSFARPVRKPLPPAPPPRAPRCGHCLASGHYTAACPRLRDRPREVGPVRPVRPVRRIEPI